MIFLCTTVVGLARVEKLNYSVLLWLALLMELFKIHFNKPDNSKTVVKYYMYVLKQIVYNHARVNILNSASRILQC